MELFGEIRALLASEKLGNTEHALLYALLERAHARDERAYRDELLPYIKGVVAHRKEPPVFEIKGSWNEFKHAFELAPFARFDVTWTSKSLKTLCKSPQSASIVALRFEQVDGYQATKLKFKPSDWLPFKTAKGLIALRTLSIHGFELGSEHFEILAQSKCLKSLKHFDLKMGHVEPGALSPLFHASWFRYLERCSIKRAYTGGAPTDVSEAIKAFARASADGVRLHTLEFERLGAGDEILEALANTPELHTLRHLRLPDSQCTAAGVELLEAATHLHEIETLVLRSNAIDNEGLHALARVPFRALEHLELGFCHARPGGVEALARASFLSGVKYLGLSGNHVEEEGLHALADVRLPVLERLDLSWAHLSIHCEPLLKRASWMEHLRVLQLDNNLMSVEFAAMRARFRERFPDTLISLNPRHASWDSVDDIRYAQIHDVESLRRLRELNLRDLTHANVRTSEQTVRARLDHVLGQDVYEQVEHLLLDKLSLEHAKRLAAMNSLTGVKRVTFWNLTCEDGAMRELARAAWWSNVREMECDRLGAEELLALDKILSMGHVAKLDFGATPLSLDVLTVLAEHLEAWKGLCDLSLLLDSRSGLEHITWAQAPVSRDSLRMNVRLNYTSLPDTRCVLEGLCAFGHVEQLTLQRALLDEELVGQVMAMPHLHTLVLESAQDVMTWFEAHDSPGQFEALKSLEFSKSGVQGELAQRFFALQCLEGLEHLGLKGNKIGPEGVAWLCQSASAPSLERLNLSENNITMQGWRTLFESGCMQRLEELDLDSNQLGGDTLDGYPHEAPPALRSFKYHRNRVMRMDLPWLNQLRELSLYGCSGGGLDELDVLVHSPYLEQVETLMYSLGTSDWRIEDMYLFCNVARLPGVKMLKLPFTNISTPVFEVLMHSKLASQLESLDVVSHYLSPWSKDLLFEPSMLSREVREACLVRL